MSSGVQRFRTGAITSTNAALTVETVGFRPKSVKLFNVTSLATLEHQDTMDADSGFKRVAAGTLTLEASNGITLTGTGFTIGALADVNDTTTEVLHWQATE